MDWLSVDEILPEKWQYVLVETKNCKYPAMVAIYNGEIFKNAHNKSEIRNVKYWCEI